MEARGNEVLSYMREALDKKRLGTTPKGRVLTMASFFMTSPYGPEDPLVKLAPFIPQGQDLDTWYESNARLIERLRREDARDKHTDRYDLHEDTEIYLNSQWIHNSQEGLRMLPFATEVIDASIILRVLYKEAAYTYDHLDPVDSASTPAA